MNEQRMTQTVNYLLFFAAACLFYGLTYYITDEHYECRKGRTHKTEHDEPRFIEPRPVINNPVLDAIYDTDIPVFHTYQEIETEYIGEYFVTAYTAEECGWNYGTASGELVEYHDEWYIPTTAAIDPRIHSFYELLMIDGKVYVCTDTGGAVKGRWVDCYVPDMESVRSWETGYKSVYSVTFTEKRIKVGEVKLYEFIRNYF